jgi:hypothetical protein
LAKDLTPPRLYRFSRRVRRKYFTPKKLLTTEAGADYYDDSFENSDALPTFKEIEQRLRTLGCTKEQISRHLDQVAKSRTQPAEQKPSTGPIGHSVVRAGT